MFIAYSGQLALGLALLSSICCSGWQRPNLRQLFPALVFMFISLAFAALIYAHVTDQFQLVNVMLHSHTTKPLLYKISGVWGNHEGSMLLWVWILSFYAYILSRADNEVAQRAVNYLGFMLVGFIAFVLVSSDPFTLLQIAPANGRDLNPLLQDPGLAIHPPLLYTGYVGFAVPYAIAFAGLALGRADSSIVKLLQKWTLIPFGFLTIGLTLGSLWAYYELGWGGWWAWDPVENAALLPWLSAVALIHTLKIRSQHGALVRWSSFLALLTFALCLLGTFLVRSGFLTSVHTFAVDPERGIFLMLLGIVTIVPGLVLWLRRFFQASSGPAIFGLNKTGLMNLGTLLFILATAVTLLGTVYPLILQSFGIDLLVGPPYYHICVVPLVVPALLLLAIAPRMKEGVNLHKLLADLALVTAIIVVLAIMLLFVYGLKQLLFVVYFSIAAWAGIATLNMLSQQNLSKKIGMITAHAGFCLAVMAMSVDVAFTQEKVAALAPGESMMVHDISLTLNSVEKVTGPNYFAHRADISADGNLLHSRLFPERRGYWTQRIMHAETSLGLSALSNVYVVLGQPYKNGKWSLHAYYKPWINLIWVGAALIALGVFLTLWQRLRYIVLLLAIPVAWGLEAHEALVNDELEQQARIIDTQLYCPVCGGQSLADSNAEVAFQMRQSIRQYLQQGMAAPEVIHAMQTHYGDKILTKPPLAKHTAALWLTPILLLLALIIGIAWRRKKL